MSSFGEKREERLKVEAEGWDAPTDLNLIPFATDADISVLDLEAYFLTLRTDDLHAAAERLKIIALSTGFHYIINHGVDTALIHECFTASKKFHQLPTAVKTTLTMTTAGHGYLCEQHHKLPARSKPNMNAAYIVKREIGPRNITLDTMLWPDEEAHPTIKGFRSVVEAYCDAMEKLSLRLLPIYAVALDLPSDYFQDAFLQAMYRFRLSQYEVTPRGEYGINPHVDTSFFTLLATSGDGLVVQGRSREWVRVPHMEGAFVVNFGAILSQITNDTWPATRHYAIHGSVAPICTTSELSADGNNLHGGEVNRSSREMEGECKRKVEDDGDDGVGGDRHTTPPMEQKCHHDHCQSPSQRMRYSLPFFFNATPTYPMAVVPSCCSTSCPPKYPTVSYLEGQGVVQGE